MTHDAHQKVKASHLAECLSLCPAVHSASSAGEHRARNGSMRFGTSRRAGMALDRVIVIDTDLGQSGASAADREGFQLVTESAWREPTSCSAWKCRAWPELDGLAPTPGDLRADRHADP
jgi:hypothetical protein